jgi:hypothetical protein
MPTDMVIVLEMEVKIEGDRTNANEIFVAVREAMWEAEEAVALAVIGSYQERVIEVLCSPSGVVAKKGYEKAATYLSNAKERLFSHILLWLQTGLICPRTTSFIENLIRELVRRLKKVGWNWSNQGAERMRRIVMIRRYDPVAWDQYWNQRMNHQGRCQIKLTKIETNRPP